MARRAPAVERAVAVLNYLAAHPEEKLTLSEFARELSLNKATLHAILNALSDAGYLVRDEAKKTYGLGPALVAVGNASSTSLPAVDYALPEMQALTDELGLDCVASSVIHDEIVILARTGTPRPFGVHVVPGQRLPLVPPIGTVFVAWSPDEDAERWLAKLGSSVSKTELHRHRESLASVVARGYSVGLEGGGRAAKSNESRVLTLQESIRGLKTEEYAPLLLEGGTTYRANHIGAPVFGPEGEVAIALFIIGFPGPITGKDIDRIAEKLVAGAQRVTKGIHGRNPEE